MIHQKQERTNIYFKITLKFTFAAIFLFSIILNHYHLYLDINP